MTIAALKALCSRIPWCEPAVLESVLELALEIAREGREGRRIGTLFTVGKADEVLAASRALILDPLAGHAPARTHISEPDLRGTMKELAQLDGAFVISHAGIVLAACRYLDASVEQLDLPLGFGSRHMAAASISRRPGAIAIVVSESGVVRVFHGGQIEATLIPELWLVGTPPHSAQRRRSGSRRNASSGSRHVVAERSRPGTMSIESERQECA